MCRECLAAIKRTMTSCNYSAVVINRIDKRTGNLSYYMVCIRYNIEGYGCTGNLSIPHEICKNVQKYYDL